MHLSIYLSTYLHTYISIYLYSSIHQSILYIRLTRELELRQATGGLGGPGGYGPVQGWGNEGTHV